MIGVLEVMKNNMKLLTVTVTIFSLFVLVRCNNLAELESTIEQEDEPL